MNEEIISKVVKEFFQQKKEVKPVALVGKITSRLQEFDIKEKDFQIYLQEVYIRLQESKGRDRNIARQSWVTASGGDFEGFVRNHINEELNKKGIVAIKGDNLKKIASKNSQVAGVVKFLMLPNKRRCTQTELKIWADSDVVVVYKDSKNQWKVLAVISCKTSDHARNTSVLFWAQAFVHLGIKYFLATQDLDNQFDQECIQATKKSRRLFEAYCDRVFSTNPSTKYCSQIKSLIMRKDGGSGLTDELEELLKATKDFSSKQLTDELLNKSPLLKSLRPTKG